MPSIAKIVLGLLGIYLGNKDTLLQSVRFQVGSDNNAISRLLRLRVAIFYVCEISFTLVFWSCSEVHVDVTINLKSYAL